MGQQIVVDSRGGASGRIGTEIASRAAPDGYTLVLGNVAPLAILPGSGIKLPYDAINSFNPISLIALSDYVLTVHPSLPVRSVKELLAMAKSRPGELTYASSGNLGGPHLGGELINLMAKVKLIHVPYKGNGPAAIAVLTGYEVTQWYGILVPAGVPKNIIDRLNKEIARAIANPRVSDLFVKLGTQPVSNTPEEFSAFIKSETDKWGKVIRAAGIKAD
jgi:tripartite-type tricarboxylate transporter receptor subunit TctC